MFKALSKKGKKPENLKETLDLLAKAQKEIELVSNRVEKIENDQDFFVQKMGIVRFDSFSGIGGKQSFSLSVLNAKNNGFIITSLYNRSEEGCRVYSKAIKNGISTYSLSDEEKIAINRAKNNEDGK